MIEVTVKIKDDDLTLTERFLVYDPFTLSHDDEKLKKMVDNTIKKHSGQFSNPDILIKIKYTW